MTALVTLEQLAARMPFVMNDDEEREAVGVLDDLSDDARTFGKITWTTPERTPQQVKNLILRAAVRHMKNPEGFVQSRAGDEQVTWTDRGEGSGSAEFTEREVKALRLMAGNQGAGLFSVGTYAWGRIPRAPLGLVPDEGSNEPIQMFNDGSPW